MAADEPKEGSRIGRYELVRTIATSEVGAMWLTRSPEDSSRSLALQLVHRHLTTFSVAEAVLREARAAQKLRHENVVDVVETVVGDGQLSAVHAHHPGVWLAEVLESEGKLPLRVGLRIARDVLAALEAAHGHEPPVFHGDLSPAFVRVCADGVTRVASFGIARALAGIVPASERAKTLCYVAPERVELQDGVVGLITKTADAAQRRQADVWSAGAVLAHLLGGAPAFEGKDPSALLAAMRDGKSSLSLEGPLGDAIRSALVPAKDRPTIAELAKVFRESTELTANVDEVVALVGRIAPSELGDTKTTAAPPPKVETKDAKDTKDAKTRREGRGRREERGEGHPGQAERPRGEQAARREACSRGLPEAGAGGAETARGARREAGSEGDREDRPGARARGEGRGGREGRRDEG
jgi:serine/threonine protein kinase